MLIIPSSNGEDNRPLREFNPHHRPSGQGGGQFTSANGPGVKPTQPFAATYLSPAIRKKAMAIINKNPSGYDVTAVMTLVGPRVSAAVTKLGEMALGADHELRAGLSKFAKLTGASIVEKNDAHAAMQHAGAPVVVFGPIKGIHRVLAKAIGEDSGDISSMRDLVRGSIAVDHPSQLAQVHADLKRAGLTVVASKDRFAAPTSMGYRDQMVSVRLPGGGIGEIQIHVKSLLAAKDVQGHKYYDQYRRLRGKIGPRSPTRREQGQLTRLEETSSALYNGVWNRLK